MKEKKKKGKTVLIVIVAVIIGLLILCMFAGSDTEETTNPSKDETPQVTDTTPGVTAGVISEVTPKPEEPSNPNLKPSDVISYHTDDGGEFTLTFTGWSNGTDQVGRPCIKIDYTIDNVGTKEVTISDGQFGVYADGEYTTDVYIPNGGIHYGESLASGRKLKGSLYRIVDVNAVETIEVEFMSNIYTFMEPEEPVELEGFVTDGWYELDPPPEDCCYEGDDNTVFEIDYYDGWYEGSLSAGDGVANVLMISEDETFVYEMRYTEDGKFYLIDKDSEDLVYNLTFYGINEDTYVDVYNDSESFTFYRAMMG